jgi:hypothetical protein
VADLAVQTSHLYKKQLPSVFTLNKSFGLPHNPSCMRKVPVAALNIKPHGTIFVGEKSKEVSMVFGSFPQKKESQVVQ